MKKGKLIPQEFDEKFSVVKTLLGRTGAQKTVPKSGTPSIPKSDTPVSIPTVGIPMSGTLPVSTYWFRYSVVWNWLSDNLLPKLEHSQQLVFLRLYRLSYGYRRNNGKCTVGLRTLARSVGFALSTVQESVAQLKARSLIEVTPGDHRGSIYKVFVPEEAIQYLERIEEGVPTSGIPKSSIEESKENIPPSGTQYNDNNKDKYKYNKGAYKKRLSTIIKTVKAFSTAMNEPLPKEKLLSGIHEKCKLQKIPYEEQIILELLEE